MNQLGNKLSMLRKKANLTQQELAIQINYSDKVISKWERGDSLPDIEALNILAKFYHVSMDDIVNKTELDNDYIPKPIYITKEAVQPIINTNSEQNTNKNFVPLIMGIASIVVPFIGLIFGIIGVLNSKIYMRKQKSTIVSIGYALSIIGIVLAILTILAYFLFSARKFEGNVSQEFIKQIIHYAIW